MEKKSTGLTVSFIDKERHAVYLDYGGCSIVLAFNKERNDGIRNNLKDILIGSVINQSKESQNCGSVRGVRQCS